MKKYIGEIGLFAVAIIWGGGLIAAKVALDSGLLTSQIMTIRFFLSAVLMTIIFFKPIKNNLSLGILKAGSVLGICLFLGFFLQTLGLEYTTPSKNAFLASINVVIVPFIGFMLYRRKIDKFGVISSFIAVLGIAVLSLSADFTINFGDLLTILCAFAFAFQIFFTSEFVKSYNPLALNTIQLKNVLRKREGIYEKIHRRNRAFCSSHHLGRRICRNSGCIRWRTYNITDNDIEIFNISGVDDYNIL